MVACGYVAVWAGLFSSEQIDHLMRFAIVCAIPCLLFNATSRIDLALIVDWRLLLSYYSGAVICFVVAYVVASRWLARRPGESVAIAFCALFSNLVLLGLPINERAFGSDLTGPAVALISVNAPVCYLLGITVMETLRADGRGAADTAKTVVTTIFKNSLMLGILIGFLFNLGDIRLPGAVQAGVDLFADASLPIALFALGGVLKRYNISVSIREAVLIGVLTLIVQPAITWTVSDQLAVGTDVTRTLVMMAAVPPGLNVYLFAVMYQRAQDVAASTVLLTTLLSVFSISAWLLVLG